MLLKNVIARIIVCNNFPEGFGHYTEKALEDLIPVGWALGGSKQRINSTRTKYSIFLKKKAYTESIWL